MVSSHRYCLYQSVFCQCLWLVKMVSSHRYCLYQSVFSFLHCMCAVLRQEEAVKSFSMERENLGVELYGVQQELARYQMLLEKHHDDFTKISQLRQRKEVQLSTVRVLYKDTQLTYNKEKKKGWLVVSVFITFLCSADYFTVFCYNRSHTQSNRAVQLVYKTSLI